MALSARTQSIVRNWLHDGTAAKELIDQVNSATSSAPAGGTTGQVLAKLSNADFDLGWEDAPVPTGPANALAVFDNSGLLAGSDSLSIDGNSKGVNQQVLHQSNDDGGFSLNFGRITFQPLKDSPTSIWNFWNPQIIFDAANSGFSQGAGGEAATMMTPYFEHHGTGDIGAFNFIKSSFDIGNGTDPISVNGMAYAFGFGTFHSGVTLTGPLQGYGFQPNAEAGVTFSSGYVNAFYDYANVATAVPGWNSFAAGPNISEIKNNSNYTGMIINPNIPTFTGNAGFTGVGIFGNYGTFGTGGWNGIQINPNVTSAQNAVGLSIFMNNVSASGNKKAIEATGDVSINGALSFTGALSIGQLNAFYQVGPVNGGGNPQTVHGLISSIVVPDNSTTANADTIGVNTAMLMSIGTNAAITSGPFGLGLSALALPCVVETKTGSSVDHMSAAVYAINLSNTSTGGTIDEINISRSVVIPNGITTVNKARGFYYSEPFGAVARKSWGFYNEAEVPNFLKGSLKIDGSVGSTDVPTNASVGLELESTTKAVLFSRMTTAQKNALTAVNGMVVYDSTLDKLQVRAAGAWVNLH